MKSRGDLRDTGLANQEVTGHCHWVMERLTLQAKPTESSQRVLPETQSLLRLLLPPPWEDGLRMKPMPTAVPLRFLETVPVSVSSNTSSASSSELSNYMGPKFHFCLSIFASCNQEITDKYVEFPLSL